MLHFKFRSLERPAYFQRKLRGPRRVAVHADRLDIGTCRKPGDSSQHFFRIVDDRTRLSARHQSAVSTIRAVSERFTRRLKSHGLRCGKQLRLGEAEQDQRSICRRDGSRDCIRDPAVADGYVVQGAVRLDVQQANALIRGHNCERLDLANNQICYLG